ncbi:hypothetical protein [Halomonas sp. 328]|uniref:hypothetical protein n=1 Tax=Halomonas sp. 328 TaxID=2776704 RepID=UPI0018A6EE2F|nr:hypothetical protein [Halomonas sp. 328]MBF8224325.1 hypothetical protein [Halomonas sp. 328]
MKVVQLNESAPRDACLARLCAEVYGQAAGLTPLVRFAATRRVLFAQEAARLLAAVDDTGRPQALALLVLDAAGQGMTLTLSCALGDAGDADRDQPRRALIAELAAKAPLRVEAEDADAEACYRDCGISRWFAGRDGQRIGLGARHPASTLAEAGAPIAVDESEVLRRFKHDAKGFEEEKERFVQGLASFPEHLG